MRLKQIHLTEAGDVFTFVLEKYDGQEADDLVVEPFDVLVKYHGEHGGHSDHPYGEGTARESHGDVIQIVSLTANEPVRVTSDGGPRLDHLLEHEDLHAVVVGKFGTGTLHKLTTMFPEAVVFKAENVSKGLVGVKQIYNFFEDHTEEDVIIDVSSSPITTDVECIAALKALLADGILRIHQLGVEKMLQFHKRIIIAVSDLNKVDDGLERRCVVIDLTKDTTFPRGTALQDLPGWEDKDMEFFTEKAHANFTGLN